MAQKPGPGGASNEKNEYIPAFITKKPFWVPDDTDEADYLEHQRLKKAEEDSKWYDRGKRKGPAATKYRKGACENCGSMTHKARDCLSRPRAKGARWTGRDIQADELVQDVRLGYDAKRDRWNGYDPSEYRQVVQEYEELEQLRKAAAAGGASKGDKDAEDEPGQDARYTEESDMGRQQSTATRNLRMREDTAKYLINLDLESARYDPKTRSMATGAPDDAAAAAAAEEEEFVRASGDAAEFERAQRFAWETQERGGPNKVHIQANPTSGEYMRKKELEEAEARREDRKKQLLERYGEQAGNNKLRKAAVVENERFVEYDERGRVKGELQGPAKSKYAEDIFTNNHTSVWGSWWHDFTWGYRCCHSTVKNSYCTGDAGREALEAENAARTGDLGDDGGEKRPADDDDEAESQKRQKLQ